MTLTKDFLEAGNAQFVLRNEKGESYEFKINLDHEGGYWFAWLVKPDEKYLGVYYPGIGQVYSTKGSHVAEFDHRFQALRFALDVVFGRQDLPEKWYLNHVGYCGRCAQKLTAPESINTGLGPVCAYKLGIEMAEREEL